MAAPSIIYAALLGDVLETQDAAEALYREARKHLDAGTASLFSEAYNKLFEARVRVEEMAAGPESNTPQNQAGKGGPDVA